MALYTTNGMDLEDLQRNQSLLNSVMSLLKTFKKGNSSNLPDPSALLHSQIVIITNKEVGRVIDT
jgi:hypothetical protein